MSDAPTPTITLGERLAGKWQIPAFALSVALLIAVGVQVQAPNRKIPLTEHFERLVRMNDAGLFNQAEALAEQLLERNELANAERGQLLLHLGRAQFGQAHRVGDQGAAASEAIVATYDEAQQLPVALRDFDYRHIAEAYENLGQHRLAVKYWTLAAEHAPAPALADRRRIIELSIYPLEAPDEKLDALLADYITDVADDPRDLLWALGQRAHTLAQVESWDAVHTLVEQYGDALDRAPWQPEYRFLLALADHGAGRYDRAERRLRQLLNEAAIGDSVYPKAGWLLGRVVMFDGQAQRPEEAVAIFRDVISSHADRTFVTAARVGLAEALIELYRYDDALKAYQEAIDDLGRLRGSRLINPDAVRTSLTVMAERARRAERLPTALAFLRLALDLVPAGDESLLSRYLTELADTQSAVAHQLIDASTNGAVIADAATLLNEAGENYVQVAWLNTLNERQASAAMWTAAGLFDEAGNHARSIELLQAFVRERSDAEIIPRALLRLGRALQNEGRYAEAVDAFQRNVSSFPRSPHANAALIPLAECFLALGPEREAEAEAALMQVLQDSVIFTPAAPEYRDAMFLLADLYSRQGRHEEAIATADEILQRYPDDPRAPQALFRLAHAYMKSAMAMKAELLKPEFVGESRRMEVEFRARLAKGATNFRALIDRMEQQDATQFARLEAIYLQDARLYEAACLFELGRYRDALDLYERAAWIYKDSPAALGAYVQVINCYLFLGRPDDAATALRRAQYLVDNISTEQFAQAGRLESRETWRRYFDWVADTQLRETP